MTAYKFDILEKRVKIIPTRPFVSKVTMTMLFIDSKGALFRYDPKTKEFLHHYNVNHMAIQRKTFKITGGDVVVPYKFQEYKADFLNEDDILNNIWGLGLNK